MKNRKAQFYVNEVEMYLMKAETALTEAHALAEKEENKNLLEQSMESLEFSLNSVKKYKD